MVSTKRSAASLPVVILMVSLVASAVLTMVHGDGGTSEEIQARGSWELLHIAQAAAYYGLAVGALAWAFVRRPGALLATALVLVALGGGLNAMAHGIDGPVRVGMHEDGLGDGDPLYDAVVGVALWLIVPGYLFLGLGGALHALEVARTASGAPRIVAALAGVLFLVGANAGWGSLLLEVIPGVTFLALVLGWFWQAWALSRRDGPAGPGGALGRAT